MVYEWLSNIFNWKRNDIKKPLIIGTIGNNNGFSDNIKMYSTSNIETFDIYDGIEDKIVETLIGSKIIDGVGNRLKIKDIKRHSGFLAYLYDNKFKINGMSIYDWVRKMYVNVKTEYIQYFINNTIEKIRNSSADIVILSDIRYKEEFDILDIKVRLLDSTMDYYHNDVWARKLNDNEFDASYVTDRLSGDPCKLIDRLVKKHLNTRRK